MTAAVIPIRGGGQSTDAAQGSTTRPARRSSTDDWCTPKWLADLLGPFDLDPCSNDRSHIRAAVTCGPGIRHGTDNDGLAYVWRGSVFCNPPYSNVGPWARRLADHDGPWCALLKLDPTTRWWATLMEASPTVAPFRKRLKFEGAQTMTANFASVLVYSAWRPSKDLAQHLWLATYQRSDR